MNNPSDVNLSHIFSILKKIFMKSSIPLAIAGITLGPVGVALKYLGT